jgi:hypothetical protein
VMIDEVWECPRPSGYGELRGILSIIILRHFPRD